MTTNTKDEEELSEGSMGFIGLGLMGRPMARHLHSAGARLVAHNRSRASVDELAALGHQTAPHARAVAELAGPGVIVLMLTNTAAVEAVLEGPDGLWAGLAPGALVIDMGASGVMETRGWSAVAAEAGAGWLDAPVSGGEAGARAAAIRRHASSSSSAWR